METEVKRPRKAGGRIGGGVRVKEIKTEECRPHEACMRNCTEHPQASSISRCCYCLLLNHHHQFVSLCELYISKACAFRFFSVGN